MELVRRIQTPEEAAEAIEVAQIFAMHRARRQQHDGISPHLSTFLLKVELPLPAIFSLSPLQPLHLSLQAQPALSFPEIRCGVSNAWKLFGIRSACYDAESARGWRGDTGAESAGAVA